MCSLATKTQCSEPLCHVQSQLSVALTQTLPRRDKLLEYESRKRKRKHNEIVSNILPSDSFLLEPHSASTLITSWALKPLLLLPRSCLSLSFLDNFSLSSSLGSTRLFKAQIKVLNSEGREPTVLIAREEKSKTLFALEKEAGDLYAVCQIGSWVSLQKLQELARGSEQSSLVASTFPESSLAAPPLRSGSKISNSSKEKSTEYKKRLAIEAIQSKVKRLSTLPQNVSLLPKKDAGLLLKEAESRLDVNHVCLASDEVLPPQASSEIFENIRIQYFETLYISRMSIAYFIKGPLSRVRAAISLDNTNKINPNEYNTFLETLLIPISLIDKKYKDGITECIQNFDTPEDSKKVSCEPLTKKNDQKRKKTLKRTKNGMYPFEDIFAQKWWAAYDDEGGNTNIEVTSRTKDQVVKARISDLRIRETQLQILIILEILALQELLSVRETGNDKSRLSSQMKMKSSKAITSDDLLVRIDVYIDRLCIWQSVALEPLEDSSNKLQNMGEINQRSEFRTNFAEDFLRNFCVDIIIPFFSSRLPDLCASITKKLGVTMMTPLKQNLSNRSSSSKALSLPGASTKRRLPIKPQLNLKQVLKIDRKRRSLSQSHDKAIALMRLATMPVLSSVITGSCETVSTMDTHTDDSPRANITQASRSRRNSPTDIFSTASEFGSKPKISKRAIVQAEFKETISVFKKPRCQVSAKDTVQNATLWVSERSSSNIFSKKGVQIYATPKSNRNALVADKTQDLFSQSKNMSSDFSHMASPSRFQSKSQPSNFMDSPLRSVLATPSRAPDLMNEKHTFNEFNDEDHLFSSPTSVCRSGAQLFHAISRSGENKLCDPNNFAKTPTRHELKNSSHDSSTRIEGCKENFHQVQTLAEDTNDIYKVLGWDNDFD